MAYRQTEGTRARTEAKRDLIVTSAIAIISISGVEAITMESVAAQAGIAHGLAYKYFPDKRELLAQAYQQLLDQDLGAMRRRSDDLAEPLHALAASIGIFYGRFRNGHLVRAKASAEIHRAGIRDELARLIHAVDLGYGRKELAMAAGSALGAIYGLYDIQAAPRTAAPAAVLFVLRGIGVEDREARKITAKGWGSTVAEAL